MKFKTISILSGALVFSALSVFIASAQELGAADVRVSANASARVETKTTAGGENGSTSTAAQASVRGYTAGDAETKKHGGNDTESAVAGQHGNATSTEASENGRLTASSHMSAVAAFVHSLLAVADREGGIGAQVRVIARSQQESASTTASAIAKVENRGMLSTLFFGSDYRSLGRIRSEMATTSANIAKLNKALEQATNQTDKAEISAQIQALENSQAQVQAFVQTHENAFSFFGWFVKLFVR